MKFFIKVFRNVSFLLFILSTVVYISACKENNDTPIICYFEITNPETGEKLYDGNSTKITWDGKIKLLDYCIRRIDNDETIYIGGTTKISYTYNNPLTGHKEYNKKYMVEKGTYTFVGECIG